MSFWDPVDPKSLTIPEFVDRIACIKEGSDMGLAPDDPIPPGKFRCWVCRRLFGILGSVAQTEQAFVARHGRFPRDPVLICPECNYIMEWIETL